MAEETITILKVGTEEAVKNVNDLRTNIKVLKDSLGDLEIGTEEYQNTLEELRVNQNALKDAMYATSSSMEDVSKSATGASESYNSLVHRMAALKEEFRATNDEVRRSQLGAEIKTVNDRLKEMDALQGNFQRNVGNYAESIKSAFSDMSVNVDTFRKSMGAVGGGLNGLKDGMEGFSKSPAIATFGILVSAAVKLAGELKENETAMDALKSAGAALKPVMDFLGNIIDKLAGYLAEIIGQVTQFVTSNGLINKVIQGVMGVGNAILDFVVAPFKGVIAAIKVFKEQGIKGIGDAAKAFGQEMKSGFSFKQNFQAGQAVAESFMAGARAKRKDVKDAGKDLGKEAKDGFLEELGDLTGEIEKEMDATFSAWEKSLETANNLANKKAEETLKNIDKGASRQLELNGILEKDEETRAAKSYEIQAEANKRKLDLLDQYRQDALDRGDLDAFLTYDQERADLEVEIETNAIRERERLKDAELEKDKARVEERKELLQSVADTTSGILGAIADAYENNGKETEKNENRIKGLRIAASTIETISGAIAAYMSAQSLPFPANTIVGAAQAALVTATGLANIAKIKATKVSASAGSSAASASFPATTSAPSTDTEIPQVRSVTSASEEVRLNRMASDQRVYILNSDIEAAQNQRKTQVAESSF